MCGIAGCIEVSEKLSEKFENSSRHYLQRRGPDSFNKVQFYNGYFYHSRLSIIDLDERSNQPIKDDEVYIVFNGEIYNFKQIRHELEKQGNVFKTEGDAEVILQGYIAWGIEGVLKRLDGMFAFAIFDGRNNSTFLARDPFGKKPLYYYQRQGQLIFNSDIRPIQESCNLTISSKSLSYYFLEGGVPQPNTIWNEVSQVKPAHYIEFNLSNKSFTEKQYWSLPKNQIEDSTINELEIKTQSLLEKAISKRTISDVPLGFFLSGGTDSGLICALAAQMGHKVSSFTVGYNGFEDDEREYAKQLSKKYGFENELLIIDPKKDLITNIIECVSAFGEPFADSSMLPSMLITQEMKGQVTVGISGDGGDELFGYNNYLFAHKMDELSRRFGKYVSLFSSSSRLLSRFGLTSNYGAYTKYFNVHHTGQLLDRKMFMDLLSIQDLLNDKFRDPSEYHQQVWKGHSVSSFGDSVFLSSTRTRLLNDYLVKVDRTSMHNSFEVRSPFLDKELANFVFSIPASYKLYNSEPKHILKNLAEKHIDPDFRKRKKIGFGIPVGKWLKEEHSDWLKATLLESKSPLYQELNQQVIERILVEFLNNRNHNTHSIWSLLTFNIWCEQNGV